MPSPVVLTWILIIAALVVILAECTRYWYRWWFVMTPRQRADERRRLKNDYDNYW